MRAVSNTSPLSNLASIGRLSLLKSQLSEIWIPPAVLLEPEAHPDPIALATIQNAFRDAWIKVRSAPATHLFNVLLLHLDRGEAEAIALAAELKADIVLIDEQEGRQLAVQAGLSVTGVLGVLLRRKAKRRDFRCKARDSSAPGQGSVLCLSHARSQVPGRRWRVAPPATI